MAFISGSRVTGTGGNVSQIQGYNVHTFDTVGVNTFVARGSGYVEVLIIGGGGGGSIQTGGSGGGGGGSVLYQRFIPITAGVSYPVIVGAGGTNGNAGTDSAFNHAEGIITAFGGDVGIGSYGLLPITPNSYTRIVGQTVTFNSTSMLANGTTLYYDITGATTSDFTDGLLTGTTTVSGGEITPINKTITGTGNKSFSLNLRADSNTGQIISTLPAPVVIPQLTVTFSSVPSTINEGASGTFNVTTTNVANGTTLYWTINNVTTLDNDFGSTSGSFTVNSNAGTFSVPIATNLFVEGAETFTVSVRIDSTSGTTVATSSAVTIPAKTYTFTTTPTTINESSGTSGNFVLTTVNVTNGTTLFWTIDNISTVDADFSATSGSFTITSNTGTFSVPIAADATLEGGETFRVRIRYTDQNGEIVATSNSVTISAATVTFSLVPSTINEGASGTFNVTTNSISNGHTLSWNINNISTVNADFGATSGTFIVNSNAGTFNVPIATNLFIEGAETFTVSVTDSGTVYATSNTVTIPAKTYAFSSIPSTINEGASGTFNVTTTNITNGTTLFWNTDHITTDAADFTSNSGSFTITSNAGSFTVPVATNLFIEGAETFRIQLKYASGELVATSSAVTIPAKTYAFNSIPSTINEGASGTFNVTTTNVANATTLFWNTDHITTNSADFTSNSGSFTITSNAGTFTVPVATNLTAEGAETFRIQLKYASGELVATSNTVTIPAKTYAFTTTPTTINESSGTSGNFVLTTTNVTNGTTLFWTILNETTVDADFTNTSGSFTITSNTGTFSVPIATDATLEGGETFRVRIRYTDQNGEIVATSNSVTISAATVTFSLVPSTINEGASGTFNVTTNSISNGHTLSWNINNISTVNADFGATSGTFIVNSNAGTFNVPIASDQLIDGSETFTVSVTDSGTVYATSSAVTIVDTTLVTTASTTIIGETQSVTFTTQAQGFANGTTLYYDIVGSAGITAADFTSNLLSGTYTVSSGVASTTLTATGDGVTEIDETFQLGVKTSAGGSILTYSPTITIKDLYTIASGTKAPVFGANGAVTHPPSGWTSLVNVDTDNSFATIPTLPFNFFIANTAFTSVFVGSNTYITFGSGSNTVSPSITNPAVPKLHFGAANNSYQRVSTFASGTDYVRIRYEGTAFVFGTVGSPTIVAEITLFNPARFAGSNVIEMLVGTHARTSGVSLIANATTSLATYTLAQNQSYVFVGNSTGTSWTVNTGSFISGAGY